MAKIKAWYEPKVARLRGAKSTSIDIYLPQWGNGKLHTLPNGEKVCFPFTTERCGTRKGSLYRREGKCVGEPHDLRYNR